MGGKSLPVDTVFTLVKRSEFVFFAIEDTLIFDISKILAGNLDLSTSPVLQAITPITSSRFEIHLDHLRVLSKIPPTWSSVESLGVEMEQQLLIELASWGLVITDSKNPELRALQIAEEKLTNNGWHPYAALFHFMTLSEESDARIGASPLDFNEMAVSDQENSDRFIERYGLPPAAFEERSEAGPALELPIPDRTPSIIRILEERRTFRVFDRSRALPLEDLSTLLRYTVGCHGIRSLSNGLTLLHRTSPSGGSLHPIGAYVLATHVDSLQSGLYHYNELRHSLEPLQILDQSATRQRAASFCNDQTFASDAHALVIFCARWGRNFWKYRRRSRTYGVVLTDLGHLSQTFYLLATQLRIGAFYTGAVNALKLGEALGLDPMLESPVGICGCGLVAKGSPGLGLEFEPFLPEREP